MREIYMGPRYVLHVIHSPDDHARTGKGWYGEVVDGLTGRTLYTTPLYRRESAVSAAGGRWRSRHGERCLHSELFPCCQCVANRRDQEAASGRPLTDAEFRARYVATQPE